METKEKILLTSLSLFSKNGFDAVSVSDISSELGMTKGALYKHYKNKYDIFESIVKRIEQNDYDGAKKYSVPLESLKDNATEYENTTLDVIKKYTLFQFEYWTENDFASKFRRLLTIEQYKNEEIAKLIKQYLTDGVIDYLSDIFSKILSNITENTSTKIIALRFYAPVLMLINQFDQAEDKKQIKELAKAHIMTFKGN